MTTGASLAHPTNWATRSGFRNGIGVIPFHPLLLTALSWIGFGLGSQRECLELIVDCWRGLTAFPWVPLPCLMVWLEPHTPWPCGPNPET